MASSVIVFVEMVRTALRLVEAGSREKSTQNQSLRTLEVDASECDREEVILYSK